MSSLNKSLSDLPVDAGFSTFLWQLFVKNEYTYLKDAHFILEFGDSETRFSAHQIVLCLRSPYFSDKFHGKGKNDEKIDNVIKLKGINPKDFEAMLNYTYDYEPAIETPKAACDIYKVAKEFQVFSLMKLCNDRLEKMEIVPSNIFDMLKASENLQNSSTKSKCLEYFKKNTSKVLEESYNLADISPSMINFLLTSKELALKSILDLFSWIYAWAKNRSLNDDTFGTTREAVDEFLPHLPFASLSLEQFANLYRKHQDVLYSDEVISFFNSLTDKSLWQFPAWYNDECKIEINSGSSE